ncbi:MAG: biopolymer transporter ExbD [Bacteroidota bacterium]
MSKKPKRGAPTIDMTAMVDVAFLLLTFFILTTTRFREEQKIEVDTPSSVSTIELEDQGLCVISVADDGRVFIGYTDIKTREAVLGRYIEEKLSEEGKSINAEGAGYFSTVQEFGVPEKEFTAWLNGENPNFTLEEYPHPGIPTPDPDSATTEDPNELKDWIRWGRMADQRMRFAIKGDGKTQYEVISNVISSLQDWNVNQFSLITEQEDGGAEAEEAEGGE